MRWLIYSYTNASNGKRYVGQTRQRSRTRKRQHKSDSKTRSFAFSAAVNKYGIESFRYEIHEVCFSQEVANEAESWWISYLGTIAPHGYNLNPGGDSGPVHPASRAKQSASQKRRFADPAEQARMSQIRKSSPGCQAWLDKLHASRVGVRASDEARTNMVASQRARREAERTAGISPLLGRKASEESKAKLSASLRQYYSDPANRARQAALNSRPRPGARKPRGPYSEEHVRAATEARKAAIARELANRFEELDQDEQ